MCVEKELPLISVIIPVYNVEKYLSKCIESICNQTYENIEIILIDDGSTDFSSEICDIYALNYPEIRVIHKLNEGVSAARNTGLEQAKGDYIAFCDSDDWYDEDMLSYLYRLIQKTKKNIASCSVIFEYENRPGKAQYNSCEIKELDSKEAIKQLHLRKYWNHWVWNNLYSRKAIENVEFPVNLQIGEDYVFNCQAIENSNGLVVGLLPKYHYFQRMDSVCNEGSFMKNFKGLEMLKKCKKIYMEKFPENSAVFEAHYILEEMAVITAMIKGKNFDKNICRDIQKHIRKHIGQYLKEKNISVLHKASAVFIITCLPAFKLVYKIHMHFVLKKC